MATQAFRKVSLFVHPDKKGGNASLFAKLVAAKELVLLKIEEALRSGEDELSKAAGRLKWLKCQCNSCAPLIVKSGNCLGCIRDTYRYIDIYVCIYIHMYMCRMCLPWIFICIHVYIDSDTYRPSCDVNLCRRRAHDLRISVFGVRCSTLSSNPKGPLGSFRGLGFLSGLGFRGLGV